MHDQAAETNEDVYRAYLNPNQRRLLWVLVAATFVVFFQAFMVAPLIPHISQAFEVSEQLSGWAVPGYLIPYGFATLVYGLLADRLGRAPLVLGSTAALAVTGLGTATAQSIEAFIAWRVAAGVGSAAIVPLSLTLIGRLFPFERRGKPMGLIFAALAGGIAAGTTLGVLAVPLLGLPGLFVAVSGVTALLLVPMVRLREGFGGKPEGRPPATVKGLFRVFGRLLGSARGRTTYGYVLLNSIFHGGVYTWLGVYFARRYSLGEVGIALAILGYGVPGFLFSQSIGRGADRWGRRWLIPIGLFLAALSALGLVPMWGVLYAAGMVVVLSIGFDLTQPLFAGIVTALGGKEHGGQAMGLNVFLLFNGFGLGALLFGFALDLGFDTALMIFAGGQALLALLGVWVFRGEHPNRGRPSPNGRSRPPT